MSKEEVKVEDENIEIIEDVEHEDTDIDSKPKKEKVKKEKKKSKIELAEEALGECENKFLRQAAEFENFKKRSKLEIMDMAKYGGSQITKKLLPVLDNFQRAISLESKKEESNQFLEGIILIEKQLRDVLKEEGLNEIESLGADFDPNYHQGVINEEVDDEMVGKVVEVMLPGYKFNDKVIRPSMVKIGIKKN